MKVDKLFRCDTMSKERRLAETKRQEFCFILDVVISNKESFFATIKLQLPDSTILHVKVEVSIVLQIFQISLIEINVSIH